MIHLITLALFIVLVVHDAFLGRESPFPLVGGLSPFATLGLTVAPFILLWGVVQCVLHRSGLRLDRVGGHDTLRTALRSLAAARIGVLLLFVWAVLGVGWIDLIRETVGDLVLVDEALALVPPVAALTLLWWSYYPIERRLREAAVLSSLELARPVPGLPTRAQYVTDQVRLHLLLVLVPLFALTVWWESLSKLVFWLDRRGNLPPPGVWFDVVFTGIQYAGVIAILATMPVVLVRVWSTVRLGSGPLRERLEQLCHVNRVRVRDLLVWRTHNAMVNGALIGVIPPFRYILLTDALLASLPLREVEAVMAHEVGHARRHHLPWILVILIASAGLCWTLAGTLWDAVFAGLAQPGSAAHSGAIGAVTIAGTVLVFGHVSRRFEEQADAFAVQHLTRDTPGSENPNRITREAAGAMSGALGSVAILNQIDPEVFSFRHGSIDARRRRLAALVGRHINALPVDRKVARLKIIGIIGIVALIALGALLPSPIG